jgi:hypothetical protein
MLKATRVLVAILLAGTTATMLLNGEYTSAWTGQVKISPHVPHLTFTQCLQRCIKPFLPDYNRADEKPFLQKCVKNCMKYQYLCKNYNKCDTIEGG